MPNSKPKPVAEAKPVPETKKPGLEVKPIKDLEPDEAQADGVKGGIGLGSRPNFSDARLKRCVSTLSGAVAKLRKVQF